MLRRDHEQPLILSLEVDHGHNGGQMPPFFMAATIKVDSKVAGFSWQDDQVLDPMAPVTVVHPDVQPPEAAEQATPAPETKSTSTTKAKK